MRDWLPNPVEADIFGTYFPPLLLDGTLGLFAMFLTVYFLNKSRLSRYFYFPILVMASLTAIYTVIFGMFMFPT